MAAILRTFAISITVVALSLWSPMLASGQTKADLERVDRFLQASPWSADRDSIDVLLRDLGFSRVPINDEVAYNSGPSLLAPQFLRNNLTTFTVEAYYEHHGNPSQTAREIRSRLDSVLTSIWGVPEQGGQGQSTWPDVAPEGCLLNVTPNEERSIHVVIRCNSEAWILQVISGIDEDQGGDYPELSDRWQVVSFNPNDGARFAVDMQTIEQGDSIFTVWFRSHMPAEGDWFRMDERARIRCDPLKVNILRSTAVFQGERSEQTTAQGWTTPQPESNREWAVGNFCLLIDLVGDAGLQ